MTVDEAILMVHRIYTKGWQTFVSDPDAALRAVDKASRDQRLREYLVEASTYHTGPLSVQRVLARSVGTCPHCGAHFNAGSYTVRHTDGRQVRFDTGLIHYAKAGHEITHEDVDLDTLLSMISTI